MSATKTCKKGHPMKQVGRKTKRWICNKCLAAARRRRGSAGSTHRSRKVSFGSTVSSYLSFTGLPSPSPWQGGGEGQEAANAH